MEPRSFYLDVDEVREMLGKKGKPLHRSRVYAWVRDGIIPKSQKGKPGARRVRLKAVHLPSGMAFHPDAVTDFLSALNAAAIDRPDHPAELPLLLNPNYPPPARPGRNADPLSPAARGCAVRLAPVARTRAG